MWHTCTVRVWLQIQEITKKRVACQLQQCSTALIYLQHATAVFTRCLATAHHICSARKKFTVTWTRRAEGKAHLNKTGKYDQYLSSRIFCGSHHIRHVPYSAVYSNRYRLIRKVGFGMYIHCTCRKHTKGTFINMFCFQLDSRCSPLRRKWRFQPQLGRI